MLSTNAILRILDRIPGLFFVGGLFNWDPTFNLNQFINVPDCPSRPVFPAKPKDLTITVLVPGGITRTYSTLEKAPCPLNPFIEKIVDGKKVQIGMHIQLGSRFRTDTMKQCYCKSCKPLCLHYHRTLKPAHQKEWKEWKVAAKQYKADFREWKVLAAARREAIERLQVFKLVRAQVRSEKAIEDKEMREVLSRHNANMNSTSSTTMEAVMRRDGFIGTTKSGRTGVVHYRTNENGQRVVATISPLTAKKGK
jgi:hypothetical protein